MNTIETHPFDPFVPDNARVLILGSFPGKEQTQTGFDSEQWFYGAKRNQFWSIISEVYNIEISSKADKQQLFRKHGIAITDIILKAERKNNSNLDNNLAKIVYNTKIIKAILDKSRIKSIFCTSRFVESHFRKLFPDIRNTEYLPSPSPRYAGMTRADKIEYYKRKLPN
ncbi:MAG TPA: DNA-deoxyinosine glycosylase [Nitrosopumilaceae archaeon]|jgi:hypoxanthine-DNA glycosylase|nr:DNA-deoxyinosine glycosylase [Nitrosopumilaceae archaeon]